MSGDVRKREAAEACVDKTFETFGRIDILVNGAAGNFLAASEDLSPNAFRTGGGVCFCLFVGLYLVLVRVCLVLAPSDLVLLWYHMV